MKENTYVLNTTQYASATSLSVTHTVSGSTLVNFVLSGVDESISSVNKVIVKDGNKPPLIYNKTLTPLVSTNSSLYITADAYSLRNLTIPIKIETELASLTQRSIRFELQRNDTLVDQWEVLIDVYQPDITTYNDVNLIKTDFFGNTETDNNLLLTFASDKPQITAMSLIQDITAGNIYDPTTLYTQTSTHSASVGWVDEYVILNALNGNTLDKLITRKTGDTEAEILLKYKTRVGVGTAPFPANNTAYYPASAFTNFLHVSGTLYWDETDKKDKYVNVPLVDTRGFKIDLDPRFRANDGHLSIARNVYFFIDLYDLTSCDNVTLGVSTLTAFVNV